MEKGKENASPITPPTADPATNPSTQVIPRPFFPPFSTPPTANPSTNPATQMIPIPFYPDFSNYMHGCHPPMPHAWLPLFVPRPDANPSTWTSRGNLLPPIHSSVNPSIGLHSSSLSHVVQIQKATPDSRKVESLSTPSVPNTVESKDDDKSGTQNIVHTEGGDSIEEPKLGIVFKSEEELFSYYKRYGKQCGFGVTTQRSKRCEDETLRYVTLGCACGGKARNRTSNVARPRPTSKTNCKAKINAKFIDGMLEVLSVHNEHNHDLSPQKLRFFRCNREVSKSVKRVLDTNDQAGIRMNKARHLQLGKGSAGALREYFVRMQYKNNGFFALIDLDDDGKLRNVFWADARSRAAYKYFGDVVTFDTTYLKNRYGMPFAPFVGVNHHGQSILLGAGLISSEDTETFRWLFETWLNCMGGKAPKAIITDQDITMKNVIATVFPKSQHRFCLWHILKKVPKKLDSHSAYKTGLKSQLLKCVYNSHTIEEFEKCWDVLITTYNLQENAWLQSLYTERTYWAPVFLKYFFWARMSITQQSESMNTFFDGYVHARTDLKEFFDQFNNALRKKIENENGADFHSFNVTIPVVSTSPLEKIFQELYMNSKFREVQQKVMGMLSCLPVLQQKNGIIATYHVEDEVCVDDFIKEVIHFVYFNGTECEVKCSCGLFEMRGILCRHVLVILRANRVRSLPDRYILDRWRKDIKRKYTLISSSYDIADARPEVNKYSHIMKICDDVATNAASCDEHAQDMINKLYAMNEVYLTNKPPIQTCSNVVITTIDKTTTTN